MGCYNVSCALSGLSIRGDDPCYFIPLTTTSKFRDGKVDFGTDKLICSNEGAMALFEPCFLPILGQYNDYGDLEKPVAGTNIKAILRALNIKKITEFLREPSKFTVKNRKVKIPSLEDYTLDEHISGCFIHKFAYDEAVRYMLDYGDSYYTHFPVSEEMLKLSGFTDPIEDKNIERYKYIYKINGEDKYFVQSDGQFSLISKLENEKYTQVRLIGSLKDLEISWKYLTNKPIIIPDFLKTKPIFDEQFDTIRNMEIAFRNIPPNSTNCNDDFIMTSYEYASQSFYDRHPYLKRYKEELISDDSEVRKLFSEINCLSNYMYLNAKMFMPTLSGVQGGDLNAEESLLTASLKYIDQQRKRYES